MLTAKWSSLKSYHGIVKTNYTSSGQHDPKSFPQLAKGSTVIMYTHVFLYRYPHLVDDTSRSIVEDSRKEEIVDISHAKVSSSTAQKRRSAIRDRSELIIAEFERFTDILADEPKITGFWGRLWRRSA